MTPREATTLAKILQLQSDNEDTSEGWITIGPGKVTLCTQRSFENATGKVTFSRRQFDALIDWYNRPQKKVRKVTP